MLSEDFGLVAAGALIAELLLLVGKSRSDVGCDMLSRNCIGLDAQPLNQTRLPIVREQTARVKYCLG